MSSSSRSSARTAGEGPSIGGRNSFQDTFTPLLLRRGPDPTRQRHLGTGPAPESSRGCGRRIGSARSSPAVGVHRRVYPRPGFAGTSLRKDQQITQGPDRHEDVVRRVLHRPAPVARSLQSSRPAACWSGRSPSRPGRRAPPVRRTRQVSPPPPRPRPRASRAARSGAVSGSRRLKAAAVRPAGTVPFPRAPATPRAAIQRTFAGHVHRRPRPSITARSVSRRSRPSGARRSSGAPQRPPTAVSAVEQDDPALRRRA